MMLIALILSCLGAACLCASVIGVLAPRKAGYRHGRHTISEMGEVGSPEAELSCTDPAYGQFDFWLGEWEVHRPDGTLAGFNRIEKKCTADACCIR